MQPMPFPLVSECLAARLDVDWRTCEPGRVRVIETPRRLLENCVADVGVETAPPYRRRGYAQAVVAAVVEELTDVGGEAAYSCAPENVASVATVRSVGFVPYAKALVLVAPSP